VFVKRFEDGESVMIAGNKYRILLPRDVTSSFEVVVERVAPAAETPLNAHDDIHQAFLILEGRGLVRVADQTGEVGAGTLVFIPRYALHNIRCVGETDLVYVYVSVWPDGVPEDRKKWKSAYEKMQKQWGAELL
jgi:mannose-6-phosphate isomerase-like protein (cupin superfamily)